MIVYSSSPASAACGRDRIDEDAELVFLSLAVGLVELDARAVTDLAGPAVAGGGTRAVSTSTASNGFDVILRTASSGSVLTAASTFAPSKNTAELHRDLLILEHPETRRRQPNTE